MNILEMEEIIIKNCLDDTQIQRSDIIRILRQKCPGATFEEMNEAISSLCKKNIISVYTYMRHGDIFSCEDFIQMCRSGAIMNGDGQAYALTPNLCVGTEIILPTDIAFGNIKPDCDFIIWFNK